MITKIKCKILAIPKNMYNFAAHAIIVEKNQETNDKKI